MMTPSLLLKVLTPATPEGDARPLSPDSSAAPLADAKSFSKVMSQMHHDIFHKPSLDAKTSGSSPLPAKTSTLPAQPPGKMVSVAASAASTLIAVMARTQIPGGQPRKPAAQTANSKTTPASQEDEAASSAKTSSGDAAASEIPQPLTVAPDQALLAVLADWQIAPKEADRQFFTHTVNDKVSPDGQEEESQSLKGISTGDVSTREISNPRASLPGKAVDADAFVSSMLMSAPVLPQVAVAKSGSPVSSKSNNTKISSERGATLVALPSPSENKPESKEPIAKTDGPRPMETSVPVKEPVAKPAEFAESSPQPIAAQVTIAPAIVSISAVSSDGTAGALSSQRMNYDGKKNEIAGRAEQKVPTASQVADFSSKTANPVVALGSDFGQSGHKQDSFDSASIMDWPAKSSEPVLDMSKGTAAAPSVDHSAAQAERVGHMVNQQVTMMRQSGANNLAVSLKVDPHTELNLQLTNHNGQIEASIRWERGATAGLDNHWKDLQESLSKVNVQLLPLENKVSPRTSALHPVSDAAASSSFNQSSQNPQRQSRNMEQDLPLAGAIVNVAAPATNKTTTRTVSRQGWESWA